jgi:hypothetical protein
VNWTYTKGSDSSPLTGAEESEEESPSLPSAPAGRDDFGLRALVLGAETGRRLRTCLTESETAGSPPSSRSTTVKPSKPPSQARSQTNFHAVLAWLTLRRAAACSAVSSFPVTGGSPERTSRAAARFRAKGINTRGTVTQTLPPLSQRTHRPPFPS